ncbi:hypothetical protein [Candidatus Formimonas warabiya]|uniref:Uncharacterized protein n=1 Tax=Formimonas warabiya TaxID=1761012 RepID=A0A3G1KRT2_FORW1|nr:hypothetical protein [Candidatus Formimonas warabiya]ATW25168.1 hypothetical protein DCMF_10660 [Candidatus Formimonas warabiya]
MRKKLWISTMLIALFLIIGIIAMINGNKQEAEFTASYSEKTGQIVVNATRPYNRCSPYEFENRIPGGDRIISLSDQHTEDDTDTFVFDILGNGVTELAFYSIDPQDASDKYKFSQSLKIVITDEAVNLNNELWRR